MAVVAIGDIGPVDGMLHVGDEAMFAALVGELAARGVHEVVGISSNVDDTRERYGIDAVPGIGFRGDRASMAERSAAAVAGRLPDDDPAQAVLDRVRSAEALLIAGGGNLASTWPSHIHERATLAAVAADAGVPVVITGQTLGPALEGDDRERVGRMLRSARLVGLREGASERLAADLGVAEARRARNVDDASFLGDAADAAQAGDAGELVATLAPHVAGADREESAAAYAGLLDEAAELTGLAVALHPHFTSLHPGEVRGDDVMHELVAARMRHAARTVPARTVPGSAATARAAALVVTSRYHPAVFALPGGAPVVGVPVDEYTTVKLRGATEGFGQRSILPLTEVLAGRGRAVVAEAWADRAATRERGRRLAEAARERSAAWWDRVVAALG